jgi:ATP-binding cassette subfamily B protein
MRLALFDHLLSLSYDFYQKTKIGDLMARSTNDLGAVRMSIGMGFVALIDGTVMAIAILVIMFVQDAHTAVLAVLPLPVISVIMVLVGKTVGRLFHRVQETYSNLSDTVQETFAGIRVVKSFAKENWFIRKFADNNKDYQSANMTLVKLFGIMFPLVMFLSGLTTLVLVFVGGSKVMTGVMSIGEFAAFFSYLQMLIWPIMSVGFMVNMLQRGAASMARINEIFKIEPSIASPKITEQDAAEDGEIAAGVPAISIKNLTFVYPSREAQKDSDTAPQPVLENICVDIPDGMFVGILGKTGSGKTTLLKTFMRLIDPPDGSVQVYGKDVRRYNLEELRSLFAVVPQDTFLFSDSVQENIAYGTEGASADELNRTIAIAALAKDMEEFPNGSETVIGERGVTLSGGQKQRTAIARALLRKSAKILVFDDALSAVDAETEKKFLTRFLEERQTNNLPRTAVIVSHRVSTLQHTDFVLVLDGGKIIESGAPRSLMESGGFFAKTAHLQRLAESPHG